MTLTAAQLTAHLEAQHLEARCSNSTGETLLIYVSWHHSALLRSLLPTDIEVLTESRDRFEGRIADAEVIADVYDRPWRYPFLAAAEAALAWQQQPDRDDASRAKFLHENADHLLRAAPFGQPYPDVTDEADLLATLITDTAGVTPSSREICGRWASDLGGSLKALVDSPHLVTLAQSETRIDGRAISIPRTPGTTSHERT